jgi:hypothetical protein
LNPFGDSAYWCVYGTALTLLVNIATPSRWWLGNGYPELKSSHAMIGLEREEKQEIWWSLGV